MIDFEAIGNLSRCGRMLGEPILPQATLKSVPEDFVVEEVPSYLPSGEGDHLFLWIQKRDLTTDQLRGHIARTIDMPARDVGIAGNKDRRAVTRQWVSIPVEFADKVDALETPAVHVLDRKPHGNKLRTGHLRGNRFEILLRADIQGESQTQLEAALSQLKAQGFANYFGTQRFGGGQTPQLGWELLTGRRFRRSMTKEFGRSLFRLSLSAVQSAVFNEVVRQRVQNGTIATVLEGDVVGFRDRRTHFLTTDPAAEQQRLDSGELVITGPIHGRKMSSPTGPARQLEDTALAQFELPDDAFNRYPKLTVGTRRPLIRWPGDLNWEFEPDGLRLRFSLDSGTYATVLLRELAEELIVAAPSADAESA